MIERTFDAAWFNGICNLPEVRPGLGGEGEIDVGPWIAVPSNYALRTEHGGFILINCGAGNYAVHTQFASAGRGAHAIEAMKDGLDYMFTRTDCVTVHSHCPDNTPAALKLAHVGGARKWFRNELHPQFGPGWCVRWDIDDWAVNCAQLECEGEEFHRTSDEAARDAGADLPEHPHDAIHNRYVGAAVRMARAGQVKKGALFYNMWAAAAGYPPARWISDDPPTIDVGFGMIVSLNQQGEMEAQLCR